MGHQPTTHATRAHLPFPSFSSFPRARTGPHDGPAQRREASRALSPSLHPGQLTGGPHPSAFPFLSPTPSPGSPRPRRRSPPLRDRTSNRLPLLFPLSSPPRPPVPHVTWQPRAPIAAPRQRSATARLFFPRASAAALPSPNPRCSRPMPAAWPWHGRRASPPSVSGPMPQNLGPPPIKPRDRRQKP
jgi:hypothetical protein